jgi:hypothetical protein
VDLWAVKSRVTRFSETLEQLQASASPGQQPQASKESGAASFVRRACLCGAVLVAAVPVMKCLTRLGF